MRKLLPALVLVITGCSKLIGLDDFNAAKDGSAGTTSTGGAAGNGGSANGASGNSGGLSGGTSGNGGAGSGGSSTGGDESGGSGGSSAAGAGGGASGSPNVMDCTGQPQGTPCGTDDNHVCRSDNCEVSICGDGVVDMRRKEACDDANDQNDDDCTTRCEKRNLIIGLPCQSDADCTGSAQTLRCGTAADGYAEGLCTKDCNDDLDCTTHACNFVCLERCAFGSQPIQSSNGVVVGGQLSTNKCHGRPELACLGPSASSWCVSRCRNDDDCGPSYCNHDSGTCQPTPSSGLVYGSPCTCSDSNCTVDPCRGFCLGGESGGAGTCAERCTAGTGLYLGGCGSEVTGPQIGACLGLYTPGVIAPAVGDDYGLCRQLCDCTSQCRSANQKCYSLDDFLGSPGAAQSIWGHPGFCTDQSPGTAELTACN